MRLLSTRVRYFYSLLRRLTSPLFPAPNPLSLIRQREMFVAMYF